MTALHARAERRRRGGVTLFLLPGLTAEQRRRAIRRLRQEASRGFGPPLPRAALVVALGRDRLRATLRTAGAVVRLHPAVTLLPGAFMVVAMALFVAASSAGQVSQTAGAQDGLAGAVVAGVGGHLASVASIGLPAPGPRSRGGQQARRRADWVVSSPTAHLPGPLDFAR